MSNTNRGALVRRFGLAAVATLLVGTALIVGRRATRGGSGSRVGTTRPRVAIVIDDFGYVDRTIVEGFMQLGIPFSAAVLPYQQFSRRSADVAHQRGKEVLLHLPMEGGAGHDPGPDALLHTLDDATLRARTRKALDSVPWIVGANNHMGSSLTEDAPRMRAVLEEIRARHLYFVDSRTTKGTVAESLAREMRIPTTRRRVFLDNDKSFDAIRTEWGTALRIAREEGSVLLIGHVYPETLSALRILIARDSARVQFVLASALVR